MIGIAHRRLVALLRDGPVSQLTSPAPAVLRELTGLQREVLVLAYFGGRTHTQIDTQLGLAPGTAADRIRGAISRLRDLSGAPRSGPTQSLP